MAPLSTHSKALRTPLHPAQWTEQIQSPAPAQHEAGAAPQRSKAQNQETEVSSSAPKGKLHGEPSQALPRMMPGHPQVEDWSILLPRMGSSQRFLHHSEGRSAPKLDNASTIIRPFNCKSAWGRHHQFPEQSGSSSVQIYQILGNLPNLSGIPCV